MQWTKDKFARLKVNSSCRSQISPYEFYLIGAGELELLNGNEKLRKRIEILINSKWKCMKNIKLDSRFTNKCGYKK